MSDRLIFFILVVFFISDTIRYFKTKKISIDFLVMALVILNLWHKEVAADYLGKEVRTITGVVLGIMLFMVVPVYIKNTFNLIKNTFKKKSEEVDNE